MASSSHRAPSDGASPGELTGPPPAVDQVVDAVGLFCPLPVMRTAARARDMAAGQVLELRADDPVTLVDLPNWCAGTGHRFMGWQRAGDELRLFVELGRTRLPRRQAR